ncbi:MAG: hypothetical protein H8D87_17645, partial [Deltaproteobacteria bacterium]|nr:hypothetical protein [Candidatus Desulfobacula maris]
MAKQLHITRVDILGFEFEMGLWGKIHSPDFIIKHSPDLVVIVETKGLEDLDVPLKMKRSREWSAMKEPVDVKRVVTLQRRFTRYIPVPTRTRAQKRYRVICSFRNTAPAITPKM